MNKKSEVSEKRQSTVLPPDLKTRSLERKSSIFYNRNDPLATPLRRDSTRQSAFKLQNVNAS